MRWGTSDPDHETPTLMTVKDISLFLHIPLSTVGLIVSTFLYRGYDGYTRHYTRWKMLSAQL